MSKKTVFNQTTYCGLVFGILPCIVFLSGCNSGNYPSGHYEGTLFDKKGSQLHETLISMEVHYVENGDGTIDVAELNGNSIYHLKVANGSDGQLSLMLPKPWEISVDLSNDADCYIGKKSPFVHFCFNADRIFLEVLNEKNEPLLTLSGDRSHHEASFQMEAPRAFSLAEAVDTALQKNFESRIEYEHVIQAKHTARAAYLNLLPHLSLSTVLLSLTPNVTSLLSSISDLAPFLLPNRWLQASEASQAAEAEKDALQLMRADLGAEVEGLTFALLRDEEMLALYNVLISRANQSLSLVRQLEANAQMSEGSADHIEAIVDWMSLDVDNLNLVIHEDKQAVAFALGFHNPEAVTDVAVGQESTSIANELPVTASDVIPVALEGALELKQIDHLIQIGGQQKDELYFSWLDPAGDPTKELGFALSDNVAVARSRVDELLVRREQLQAVIAQSVSRTVEEWNQSLESFPLIQKTLDLQERRLKRVLAQIQPGTSLNTLDVEAVFQDYLNTAIRRASLNATFRVARSKMDRLLYRGQYSRNRVQSNVSNYELASLY